MLELLLFVLFTGCFFGAVGSALVFLSIDKKMRYTALIVFAISVIGLVICGLALHSAAPM